MKNGDTDTISDALKMFGDQDSAAKWFGHLNTKSDGSSIISDLQEILLKECNNLQITTRKLSVPLLLLPTR